MLDKVPDVISRTKNITIAASTVIKRRGSTRKRKKYPMPAPSTPQIKTGRTMSSDDDIASVLTEIRAPRFKIIDESDDYIVVDKPAFLLTHPTKPDQRPTLWKQLRELLAFEIANGGQVSIVNRLDRETSGIVLVAKTSAAARRLGLLMQQQRVQKEYLAIVWGWPEWETKIVDAPLDRKGKHEASAIWLKQMIHPKGAQAVTEFRVERPDLVLAAPGQEAMRRREHEPPGDHGAGALGAARSLDLHDALPDPDRIVRSGAALDG